MRINSLQLEHPEFGKCHQKNDEGIVSVKPNIKEPLDDRNTPTSPSDY
jgi:hypothetical protein